ncbi:MAG: hypothetical protein IJ561_07540 [Ruminococcus sp.]|nr:hypothetical protein [Ruminococcus sp.]
MNERRLKRLILSLAAVSYFLLHSLLLIIMDFPMLLVLFFSVLFIGNMLGLNFFFCITVEEHKAVFSGLEYIICAGCVPAAVFTVLTFTDAFGFREVFLPTLLTVISGTLLVLCVDIMIMKDSNDDDE